MIAQLAIVLGAFLAALLACLAAARLGVLRVTVARPVKRPEVKP